MSNNSMTTLSAWFKESYADKISDLTPENLYLTKEIPALSAEKQPGGTYIQPCTLSSEQGFTLAGASAGAFALNSPIAMATAQASIAGSQFVLRSGIDYETILRSKNKNSFVAATKGIVKNMIKSSYWCQEAELFWGKAGLGIVSAVAGNALTITTATYAPALWLGSKNRRLRIETTAGVLRGTCAISSYDVSARTVTVDAAPAGTAATDVIWLESAGASGANEMQGLYGIVSDTTNAMFGINPTTYDLWSPSTAYSCGNAPVTFNKVMMAIAQASNKGLGDDIEEVDVLLNPFAYQNLLNDAAAGRNMDSSYKSSMNENGFKGISFYSPAGKVNLIPTKFMKEGYAFVLPKCSKSLVRVGCQSNPTFELPGMSKDGKEQAYLRTMENNAGCELRQYWNTSLFTDKRNQMILMNNIVNATA